MTHTSEGSSGTSTVTQTPDSVTIECGTFSVNAKEEISFEAPIINSKGSSKVNIESQVATVKAPSIKLG